MILAENHQAGSRQVGPKEASKAWRRTRAAGEGSFHDGRLANLKGCRCACGWGATGTVLVGGAGQVVP